MSSRQAAILGGIAEVARQNAPQVTAKACAEIIAALEQFRECVRYLNVRRSKGLQFSIANEADVQDAVFLMLRPWVQDLVYENPTDKVAGRYSLKDFLAPSARTVIEAKYIRDEAHGRNVSREIHDDMENYRHHPACDNIIFFLYDPDSVIPDEQALRAQVSASRVYDGRPLYCHLVVP